MNQKQAKALAFNLADMAANYPNHEISNALSRVSQKLESYGEPFAQKLTTLDKKIISFYYSNKK